jgi:hypothetical protein
MSTIASRRAEGGASKIALRFAKGALKGSGSILTTAMAEEGLLFAGGAVSAWRFENLIQDEEGAFLLGPDFPDGRGEPICLDDAASLEEGLSLLQTLAAAFARLSAEGRLPRGLVSSGILLRAAEILILPPVAAAKALATNGSGARERAAARLESPASDSPEADASFFLAQAAYRFATGASAYEEAQADVGSLAPARRTSTVAALAAPRLDPELSALIDAALADPKEVGLDAWIAALEKASLLGWQRDLPPEEAAELERRRAAAQAEAAARKNRSDFWRKRGGIVAGAAVALVVCGFIAADMLRAQNDKPDFSALPADQVVANYYKAVDAIDLESLEACGDKKAVDSDWNYVMNLTVITKTRLAYEGKSPIVPAAKWVAAGKPALTTSDFLYGIDGMALSQDGSRGPDLVAYRASYSFWSLERKEGAEANSSEAAANPIEEKRVDEITLQRSPKWKGWRITSLERTVKP